MKQILHSLNSGETWLDDVPLPASKSNTLFIRSMATLVSSGTERMLLEFGRANMIDKARKEPDKVRMMLDKVRTDGLMPTVDAIRSKLAQPLEMGYCNAGVVAEVGKDVHGFSVGDHVISNGKHAEYVCVPGQLCARVPEAVSDEHAAFTVIAAIGLQGVRLANPTLGECVVVMGLGVIGLVTVQILRAQGCRVMGIDFDSDRLALAKCFGAEVIDLSKSSDPLAAAAVFSRGRGVDAVLITTSTKSNEPVSQAAKMSRQRGRVVLVGVTGLELSRADFYEKELTFQVSCSYGPGRYDPFYEDKGHDYPIGFVRWTEQRNFEAVLELMATGKLDVAPLISHRFPIDQAICAYDLLASKEAALGIILEYGCSDSDALPEHASRVVELKESSPGDTGSGIGAIGAGNYAGRVLLPAFRNAQARLVTLVSSGGASSVHYGKKHGFSKASTDPESVFTDSDVTSVVIATRHDSHAEFVLRSIQSGKHVFVEKPLCLSTAELEEIQKAAEQHPDLKLMVGFNRRFSPLTIRMKALLVASPGPKSFIMTVNAGDISRDHWTQDPEIGGGRIVGEACHFIDLIRHLVGTSITGFAVTRLADGTRAIVTSDKASIALNFADGSFGVIHYLANGHKAFPKERLEVFCGGKILQLDNFRSLKGWGWKGFSGTRLWRQDKGQKACVATFMDAIRTGAPSPIPMLEIMEVSRVSIEAQEALS